MAIKPVLHRIIVLPHSFEEKDEAYKAAKKLGIIVGELQREREQAAVDSGVVKAIGATAFKDFGAESPIKVGDTIVYARYGGKTIVDPEDNVKYVALNDEDIIAITTEGA